MSRKCFSDCRISSVVDRSSMPAAVRYRLAWARLACAMSRARSAAFSRAG